jgi:hypothetical protein
MVKLTAVPFVTGLPFMSFTVNWTREVSVCPNPLSPSTCGVAEVNAILPDEGAVIVKMVLSVALPEVAVTVTWPAVLAAVKVAVARPLEVVATVEIDPNVDGLNANETDVPSGTATPLLSSTVAVMLDDPFTDNEAGFAVSAIVAASTIVPDPPPPIILPPTPP